MRKKVHLLCNAHIDQIWQWEWEEGASCALSTFQSAANLLNDFDYKFNHNEVVLYKYTKKFAPALFNDIKAKVKKEEEEKEEEKKDENLAVLEEIRDLLKKQNKKTTK